MTCVLAVLQNYANKLKSGWKIVLSLINFALSEQSPSLNLMANRVKTNKLNKYFINFSIDVENYSR